MSRIGGVARSIWRRALRGDAHLTGVDATPRGTRFRFLDARAGSCSLSVPRLQCYSLGIDIVGYRRRSWEGQIFLSATVMAALDEARDLLRRVSWLPLNEAQEAIFTGDGAILLVDALASALALMFTVNMLIADANRADSNPIGIERNQSAGAPIFPCLVRYALASGETVNLAEPPRSLVLGPAVGDCHRILDASRGPDLLIQDAVMRELAAQGGINGIAGGGGRCEWAQRLTTEPMASGGPPGIAVHRAFGTHGAAGLLAELARRSIEFPAPPDGPSRIYGIGAPPERPT